MKTPDYLSYDRYKKKKDENPNRRILIFVATFFATLLVFTVIAKSLSPDVDVTIGDDPEMEAKETGLGVKKFIDDRLKMIQMDDNGGRTETEEKKIVKDNTNNINQQTQVTEEKINIPTTKQQSQDYYNYNNTNNSVDSESEQVTKPISKPVQKTIKNPPRPTGKDLGVPYSNSKAPTATKSTTVTKSCKVYVGRYSTLEQAKVAQEILMDSGMGVTPFVRDMGNSYTLQIGSYSSKAKADGLASELHRNNFPARVVQD